MYSVNLPTTESGGWFHLVPIGEFPHHELGHVQVIDAAAIKAMLNRFAGEAQHPNFGGLLIDREHWSYDPDKSSESFGWVKELQSRADGIWGRVEFSDLGAAAVRNRRYKFVSPVFTVAERLGGDRVRPVRLDSVGFTNNPNFKGMVPMTNRDGAGGDDVTATIPISELASDLLLALANRATGGNFEDRWFAVGQRNPLINRAASGQAIYANRAYAPDIVLSAQDREVVSEGAKILESRMERADAARDINNQMPPFAHTARLETAALKYIADAAARHGLDYLGALKLMEERDPILFSTWAANQTSSAGEIRRFA